MNSKIVIVGIVLSVLLAGAMPASADTARIKYAGRGYCGVAGYAVDFDWDGTYDAIQNNRIYTGEYKFNFDAANSSERAGELLTDPFYAYCIDLGQWASSSWHDYNIVDLEDAPDTTLGQMMGEAKANDLRELFGRFGNSVVSTATGQAFGASVWEIVFENPVNGYDIDSGALMMNGMDTWGSENAHDIAQDWLSQLNGDTSVYDWDVFALSNPDYQDFGITSPGYGGAIPEPMTMLAVAAGLSGIAGYVRRRRRA